MLHRHANAAVAAAYSTGAVTGGLVTACGLLLIGGLVSPIPATVRASAAIAGIALLGLRQAGILGVGLPQRRYQIPRESFEGSPKTAADRFAFELGTGVRTYVTSSAPYALILVATLAPAPSLGAAVIEAVALGAGFGLGRSAVVACQAARSQISIEPPSWALDAVAFISIGATTIVAIQRLA